VELVEPKEGMSICDPTCGSGSMLIESRKYVECSGRNPGITRHGIPKDVKMMALFTTVEEKAVVTQRLISRLKSVFSKWHHQCLYFFLIIKFNGAIPNQMY
jgi:23S rRNA G2445 N2-methylase RlmL